MSPLSAPRASCQADGDARAQLLRGCRRLVDSAAQAPALPAEARGERPGEAPGTRGAAAVTARQNRVGVAGRRGGRRGRRGCERKQQQDRRQPNE
jgi:hypothetical protein